MRSRSRRGGADWGLALDVPGLDQSVGFGPLGVRSAGGSGEGCVPGRAGPGCTRAGDGRGWVSKGPRRVWVRGPDLGGPRCGAGFVGKGGSWSGFVR